MKSKIWVVSNIRVPNVSGVHKVRDYKGDEYYCFFNGRHWVVPKGHEPVWEWLEEKERKL